MKCASLLIRHLKIGYLNNVKYFCENRFVFKRILILNKRTRYELEKALCPDLSDEQLEIIIRKRGSDFDRIVNLHYRHKEYFERIVECFCKRDLTVKTVNRTSYGEKEVSWADLIVVAGGDGTFLLGASQIHDLNKPIVGFNTNPDYSEGYLCLPKKYSSDIDSAVTKILKNDFQWLMRSRIEVEVQGSNVQDDVFIFDSTKKPCTPEYQQSKIVCGEDLSRKVLPSLALNEVFMGENISSQTSSLIIKPDGYAETVVKCSGLCVSTGTGSTSWHMSINRLTEDKIRSVMKISGQPINNVGRIATITQEYNSSLRFSPDDIRLFWSLREPIYSTVYPDPPGLPAGAFSNSVSVRSHCFSGCLVIDGTHCYPFHDGTVAHLYINPNKSLRSINFEY